MNNKKLFFLNQFGYNLQCHERPLALMLESLYTNSMFLVILFKEFDCWNPKENLLSFLESEIDIRFNEKNIYENKTTNILSEKRHHFPCILYSDHFYNDEYELYYQIKHYPHPILLLDYDESDNSFNIIDEDILEQKEYDKFMFWTYSRQKISYNSLKKIGCNWTSDIGNPSKSGYRLFYLENKSEPSNISIEYIMNKISENTKKSIDNLYEKSIFLDEVLKKFIDFPYENSDIVVLIYDLNKAINRNCRLIELLKMDDDITYVFIQQVNSFSHELINFRASLLKHTIKKSDDAEQYYANTYDISKQLERYYYLFLDIIECASFKNRLIDKVIELQD